VDADADLSIQRWTKLSLGVAIVVAALFVLLAVGPAFLPGNILDKLTVLFIYVLLAAMWNALAGYGGMISAGQQAFFGLGGYLAIRLSEWGIWPYPALIAAALLAGLSALPISAIVLRLRAGEFAIGTWIIAECVRLLVNLDPIIQGDTGRSLIALSAFNAGDRRILTYSLSLVSMAVMLGVIFLLLRSRLGSSIQAIRDNEEAAASVGVRVSTAKRIIFVVAAVGCALAGALWLASFTTFQHPRERLHDFYGFGRRHRALRRTDPRRHHLFPDRDLAGLGRRLVSHSPRFHRSPVLLVLAQRDLGLYRGSLPHTLASGWLPTAGARRQRDARPWRNPAQSVTDCEPIFRPRRVCPGHRCFIFSTSETWRPLRPSA
jgi:ABC-type branched-subunit amino acid transport system permease subunit